MDIHLDRSLPLRLGDQLKAQVRALVHAGALRSGDPLPTVRELAAREGINVNTVAAAYAELESEGYLVQRKRAGTHVAPSPPASSEHAYLAALGAEASRKARALTIGAKELVETVAAHAAMAASAPRFRVALVAENALQSEELLARARMLFRPEVALLTVAPGAHDGSQVHLTVIHPALAARLAGPGATLPRELDFSAEFPAPAD